MMWGKKQTYSRQELRDAIAREIADARAMREPQGAGEGAE